MGALTWGLQTGLLGALRPAARAFDRATCQPEEAQRRCLSAVLEAVAGSAQARTLGLKGIEEARSFQDAVPLSDSESLRPQLEALAQGKALILTGEAPVRFECSGGSSGPHKLLPMTRGSLAEFQRALAPWIADLLRHRPALRRGPAYWSVSPIGAGRGRSVAGIPVGSDSDSSYLPGFLRPLVEQVLAVPGALARLPDVETCRYVTLRCLLARADLAMISVWNPSFLTLLLEGLDAFGERLVADLENGTCRPPRAVGADASWDAQVEAVCRARSFRTEAAAAARLRWALSLPPPQRLRVLWPRLGLVSCWADADARRSLPPLQALLGDVEVQGKGLLATEGVVTFPLLQAPAPVLAVRSHFYEFLPEDAPEGRRPRLAHEVSVGQVYRVVLSTSAGLLRYQLGDRVRVEGFWNRTPCLRFLGRGDTVVDLVGEKLSLAHVSEVLTTAIQALPPGAVRFSMLAPEWSPRPGYTLFVEGPLSDATLAALARELEARLCVGHTYGYARALGQLRPVEACRVVEGTRAYEARCVALGQRAGDIKPLALHRLSGWRAHFAAMGGGSEPPAACVEASRSLGAGAGAGKAVGSP